MVSVIIPAYNAARYLREAVNSALQQSYSPLEVIVVNDGSTDESEIILREFGDKIRYFRKPHEGLSKTRNFGLKVSKGEYVAFLDADDIWKPEKLQKQMEMFSRYPEVGMVYCAVDLIDERGQPIEGMQKSFQRASIWIFEKLLEGNFISISTVVIKKDMVDKVGFFNEKFKIANDYDYWLRLSLLTQVDCLSEPLALYRLSPYAMSVKKDRVRIEDLIIGRRYAHHIVQNSKSILRERESVILQDVGIYYLKQERYKRARICLYGSWKRNKWRIKSLAYYFISILPKAVILFLKHLKRKFLLA